MGLLSDGTALVRLIGKAIDPDSCCEDGGDGEHVAGQCPGAAARDRSGPEAAVPLILSEGGRSFTAPPAPTAGS